MPPNVLLVCTDQQRGDAVGADPQAPEHADGGSLVHTPTLDRIAAEGTLFSRAYSTCPSCTPARRTLYTGLRPATQGCVGSGCADRGPVQETLPHLLGAAGYRTHGVGKIAPERAFDDLETHFNSPARDDDYDAWLAAETDGAYEKTSDGLGPNSWDARPSPVEEYQHPTHWTTTRAMDFLDDREGDRPFFLTVSYAHPPQPWNPPQVYWDMFADEELGDPAVGEWAERRYADRIPETPAPATDLAALSERRIHRARVGYYGLVAQIDNQLFRLVRHLQDLGEWENTLVVFTSDHGEMLGDHHRWKKSLAFEGSARIPLVLGGPALDAAGGAVDRPVGLEDVLPTVLDAADVAVPADVEGDSLLALARDAGAPWRSYIHGEYNGNGVDDMQFLVDDAGYKYVWQSRTGEELLFDVDTDPAEEADLSVAPAHEETLAAMRERLVAELAEREEGFVADGELVAD
jgi:arylsulfatase